jgi:hypothetical protein
MSNSTPQGPGPEFGSHPDASPIDETEAVQEAMDEESAELAEEGDDGSVIDISKAEGPDVSGGDDVG